MATQKLTITLATEEIAEVRDLVAAGRASSISGFVQHAVRVALSDAAGWQDMLNSALENSGGPLTDTERTWADSILNEPKQKRSKRRLPAA